MLTVTKKFEFCYGHRLPDYDGKCANQHGHNSVLEVEVSDSCIGLPAPKGMIEDFSFLKSLVEKAIINKLDHKYINNLRGKSPNVSFLTMVDMPTAENIVKWIVQILQIHYKEGLIRVRLYETSDSYAEWRE